MWKLGRFLGIEVSLHWTLLLFIAFTAVNASYGGVVGAVTLCAIFGCVLLHEFGHAMAARQFGIPTSSIVLLPFGGIASLERMPRNPLQELWIAVAGPLVNVAIAGLLLLLLLPVQLIAPGLTPWIQYLLFANIVLVVFNLLPAFPMDGGRVLRSLLALRLPYIQATNIAASVGRVVAVGLGLAGLFASQFMLLLIAIFIFFAGSAEARAASDSPRSSSDSDPTRRRTAWSRPVTSVGAGRFTGNRAGRSILVVWDEKLQRYRYAT